MQNVSRKAFVQTFALSGGALLTSGIANTVRGQSGENTSAIELKSDAFSFSIRVIPGGLACHLIHVSTGTVLADGPYSYSFGPLDFKQTAHDDSSARFQATTDTGLQVTHIFRLPAGSPWLEEDISINNSTANPVYGSFRCGFILPVKADTLPNHVFTAVPFRRELRASVYGLQDFFLREILYQTRGTSLREDSKPSRLHSDYLSEGWAATDNKNGFLFTKYNQTAREFAILDNVPAPGGLTGLRWGGAGIDLACCEGMCSIPPGTTHSFGVSRITAFQGDVIQGFYAFRREMESRGVGLPANFNPPVHWNELYDNKLLNAPGGLDDPDNRKKYYTIDDMKGEAAKAKAIGCEALYCDPGWDTNFASKIWDTTRLGSLTDFIAMLKNDYGLKLSLHTPLSGWCNPTSYPTECFRTDKAGNRAIFALCGASKQYVDETVKRLNVLAEAGVVYFMFDGTSYNVETPCWNPTHGHSLPLTMAAHVDATNLIACKVHEAHPYVSIEMHDQVMGGAAYRYVPLYYGYGKNVLGASPALGFDTIWAFEMMWSPLSHLMDGDAFALYYYNLAYSVPLYLHIDLRGDNENALAFWWNASTVRYLGIGGTDTNPKVNEAHAAAMKIYMRLKPYFSAGTFYGISETVHVHRHPTDNAAVMNCFAIHSADTLKFQFDPAKVGLRSDKQYKFTGATFVKNGEGYFGEVSVAAGGHTLVEVTEV